MSWQEWLGSPAVLHFQNSPLRLCHVFRVQLHPNEPEPFQHSATAGGAAASEWIENQPTRWRDEFAEVAHQRRGLNCWVSVGFAAVAFRCFGTVEETGCGAGVFYAPNDSLRVLLLVSTAGKYGLISTLALCAHNPSRLRKQPRNLVAAVVNEVCGPSAGVFGMSHLCLCLAACCP